MGSTPGWLLQAPTSFGLAWPVIGLRVPVVPNPRALNVNFHITNFKLRFFYIFEAVFAIQKREML